MRSFLRLLPFLAGSIALAAAEPPRLVLQITVDQLRGDMLPRYREKFTGGFKQLLDRGLYYTNAHYQTANTFTAAGHAVLVTGADTAEHGMVANEWWDRKTGKDMYCTFDAAYPVLGEPPKSGAGMSPANLSSTTIGDEIVSAGLGRSFALAGKDRSAIIPGGHLGKAYWFSEKTGGFTNSTWYGDKLPAWLSAWNDTKPADHWRNQPWKPLDDPNTYAHLSTADNAHACPNAILGRAFPHPLVAKSDALFWAAFRYTPFLDELTAKCAQQLITAEKLGTGQGTDYLSISFSGHDYIGHCYGPNSMEYEDSLRRLDVVLAELFASLDKTIGLDQVLIVLSADHGVDDIPEAVRERGIAAGRIYPDKVKTAANTALRQRLGIAEDLVAAFVPPGFYLDQAKLADLKLDSSSVETALAEHLRTVPGIAHALTRTDLLKRNLTRTPLLDKVQRAFHPTRSGDVVIVQDQCWYLYPKAEEFAAMHGSPYAYDTFVPIILCGEGVKSGEWREPVSPGQIAPTLASLLGIKPPSGCAHSELLPGVFAGKESEN